MLKKGNKLYSILTGSCPKCHNDGMYIAKNPYRPGYLFKMHDHCSVCGTKYKIEPSFFYGAMYVSYAVGVGISVLLFIISYPILNLSLVQSFVAIVVGLIIFMPVIVRLSRNIWINLFISFDAKGEQQSH